MSLLSGLPLLCLLILLCQFLKLDSNCYIFLGGVVCDLSKLKEDIGACPDDGLLLLHQGLQLRALGTQTLQLIPCLLGHSSGLILYRHGLGLGILSTNYFDLNLLEILLGGGRLPFLLVGLQLFIEKLIFFMHLLKSCVERL